MLAGADAITHIAMRASLYPFVTDTVPFTSLVLSGDIELYSVIMNGIGTPLETELRMIEWGVFPNFLVTHRHSSLLMYTRQSHVVSSMYGDWRGRIINTYHNINGALNSVSGYRMVRHDIIAPGVAVSAYENGVMVIVNYTANVVEVFGVSIPPMGYGIIER
jgi:hypothetical protein